MSGIPGSSRGPVSGGPGSLPGRGEETGCRNQVSKDDGVFIGASPGPRHSSEHVTWTLTPSRRPGGCGRWGSRRGPDRKLLLGSL